MATPPVPGSETASERAGEGTRAGRDREVPRRRGGDPVPDDEEEVDGFDSEEFRDWLRDRRRRPDHRRRRRDESDGPNGHEEGRGSKSGGPPPEWNGETSFQDYLVKARLWLVTTKSKPCTRGPLLLQRLSGVAFNTMKYLAKDSAWMASEKNGDTLLDLMDEEENFGEDRDEDLLSSLAKVTYHLRRARDESHRAFFNKWDTAMRKVAEHKVQLPPKYEGFLLVNALCLSESEIKSCLNYTRGSIISRDVREWVRKHETKLQVSQVGIEKDKKSSSSGAKVSAHYLQNHEDADDEEDDEIHALEEALVDLTGEDGASMVQNEDDVYTLEESEAAEILSTMLAGKKTTYAQSIKAKKTRELARGYGGSSKGKGGRFKSAGDGTMVFQKDGKQVRMTLEEVKKITKCAICRKVGHWHRECPEKNTKEQHYITLESEEASFCGYLEMEPENHHKGYEVHYLEPPESTHGMDSGQEL